MMSLICTMLYNLYDIFCDLIWHIFFHVMYDEQHKMFLYMYLSAAIYFTQCFE